MKDNQKEKIVFSNNLKKLVANSNLPQREIELKCLLRLLILGLKVLLFQE